jgi:hypothetical protein
LSFLLLYVFQLDKAKWCDEDLMYVQIWYSVNERRISLNTTYFIMILKMNKKQYQKKWLQHVQRMGTNRLPKQALHYRLEGRRNLGRPKKRWTDQIHFEV